MLSKTLIDCVFYFNSDDGKGGKRTADGRRMGFTLLSCEADGANYLLNSNHRWKSGHESPYVLLVDATGKVLEANEHMVGLFSQWNQWMESDHAE
jgi:hypothetical protein